MKNAIIIGMALLMINGACPANLPVITTTGKKQACSLGIMPRLRACCLKKLRKERSRYTAQTNPFKQAIDNSLHFIADDAFAKLIPSLK